MATHQSQANTNKTSQVGTNNNINNINNNYNNNNYPHSTSNIKIKNQYLHENSI